MRKRRLVEPRVEKRYTALLNVYNIVGVLAVPTVILMSFLAFQRDVLLGMLTVLLGVMLIVVIVALSEAIRVFLAIEENTRRVNTMAPYTMQTTTNLTAIHDAMEEITASVKNNAQQIQHTTQNLHDLTEKLDAIALYTRTSALLLHRQGLQQEQATQQGHASNGSQVPGAAADALTHDSPPAVVEPLAYGNGNGNGRRRDTEPLFYREVNR